MAEEISSSVQEGQDDPYKYLVKHTSKREDANLQE